MTTTRRFGCLFDYAVVDAGILFRVYQQATIQLNAIWEDYLNWATAKDAFDNAERFNREEEARRYYDRASLLENFYQEELKKWKKSWVPRGPTPRRSVELMEIIKSGRYDPAGGRVIYTYQNAKNRREEALRLRNEVDEGYKVAQSGAKEFHLTPNQLMNLNAWRDGTTISRLKQQMLEDPLETQHD